MNGSGMFATGYSCRSRSHKNHTLSLSYLYPFQMVLPDGTHVRFGPEEWDDDPGYLYPKTTKVKGYCNENPEVDEDKWIWKVCFCLHCFRSKKMFVSVQIYHNTITLKL